MTNRASSCPPVCKKEREVVSLRECQSTLTLNVDDDRFGSAPIMWQSWCSSEDVVGSYRTSTASPLLPFYWIPGLPANRANSEIRLNINSTFQINVRRAYSMSTFREGRMERQASVSMSGSPFNHCSWGCPCHDFERLSDHESSPIPFYFAPQLALGLSLSMPCLAVRGVLGGNISRSRSLNDVNRSSRIAVAQIACSRYGFAVENWWWGDEEADSVFPEHWDVWDVPHRRYDDDDDDPGFFFGGIDGGVNVWFDTAPAA